MNPPSLHPDILAAAELLAAGGPAGNEPADSGPTRSGPASSGPTSSGPGPRAEDEKALADHLYPWYLNPTELEAPNGPLRPFELDLPAALRAAHCDSTRFEGGWRAERVSTWGRVVARKGELERFLDRSEYLVPSRPGLRAQPGDALVASSYWSWVDEATGFWHARRHAWPPEGADRLVRIYWNVSPEAAPRLLHELSAVLADAPTASYMVKTPARPEHSGRADAFVLYLGPLGFGDLETGIRDLAGRLSGTLRPAAPRFTLPLGVGVALAEGDITGESFGEARCRLVARAFLETPDEKRRSATALAAAIAATFVAAGLDPHQPHLEPHALPNPEASDAG